MHRTLLAVVLGLSLAAPALADTVKVENAWVRATAPGQMVAGGYMDLTADADMTLVGGSSPVSKAFELHLMRMENGVMEMRQIQEIALPRGKLVSLAPGGLHLMLIGLRGQIKPGQQVPMTLIFKGADGKEKRLAVAAEARKAGGHR